MLIFNYQARNATTGEKVKAQVQADTKQAAAKLIKDQGLSPLSIELQESGRQGFFNKVRVKDKVLFARQLSTLISAGLPLVQSLRNVQQQTSSKPLKAVIGEVISDVEGGQTFSASLAKHPLVFSPVFINMVAAGEVSGTLDASLERLANQQEKDAEILSKIKGAMIYPAVVILVMVAVVGFMIVSVIPQVKNLYDGIPGATLPLVTKIMLAVSDFVINFWWVLVILLIIAIVFGSRWARTIGGKRVIDGLKLSVKPINRLYKKMYMARFARTGSTLIASGVPLIQMLEVTSDAISNVYLQESIGHSIEQVKGGKSLADSLEGDPYFLELVPNMLHIGEQSGSMEAMMGKVADYYEKEVDNEIKNISTIIEPALMIMLGIVALAVVAAVLLPIYSLAGKSLL
jgi:type IV pilus assembly protein PilC